jgi:hypothetical protein
MRAWLLSVLLLVACATPNPQSSGWQPPPRADASIAVGDRAPEVVPARVTLVVFWATWSEPSKQMSVKLEEIWKKRRERGFALKSVNIDDEATLIEDFRKTYGLTYTVEWDRDHRLAGIYRPASEPALYVVDRAGIVRFVHGGWRDDDGSKVADEVDSLL